MVITLAVSQFDIHGHGLTVGDLESLLHVMSFGFPSHKTNGNFTISTMQPASHNSLYNSPNKFVKEIPSYHHCIVDTTLQMGTPELRVRKPVDSDPNVNTWRRQNSQPGLLTLNPTLS